MAVKVYESGVFWKTREVELIRMSGKGMISTGMTPFDCSVEDKKVYEQLQKLLDKEVQIKVQYHTEMFVASWRGDTSCMIDEILGEVAPKGQS